MEKQPFVILWFDFWDVANGEITLGGRNIKDYTLESLLSNFSMVFQNVYLLRIQLKTILNLENQMQPMQK